MLHTLHPNLKVRLTINFLQKLTQTAIFPFLTLYFVEQFGTRWTGPLIIVTTLGALLASLYGGTLADRFGRKRVLWNGELFRLFSFFGMALVAMPAWHQPIGLFVFFFLNNLFSSAITPANEAILIDDSTSENRTFLYTVSYWSLNISIVVGSLIGGFFFQDYVVHLLVIATGVSALCVALIRFGLHDTYRPTPRTKKAKRSMWQDYRHVLTNRLFLLYLLAGILTLSLELQLTHYLAVHFIDRIEPSRLFSLEWDGTRLLGLVRAENTLLVLLLGLFVARWTKRFQAKQVLYVGVVLFSLGFAAMPLTDNVFLLLLGTACFTVGELLYVPIHQALLAKLMDDHLRSQYLAVNGLRYRGALLIGAISVSLYEFLNPIVMSLLYTLFGGVALFLYHVIHHRLDQRHASHRRAS